jgi:hypothetical protein
MNDVARRVEGLLRAPHNPHGSTHKAATFNVAAHRRNRDGPVHAVV